MQISIIGAGVVGRTTGIGLESNGHNVGFVDINSVCLNELHGQGHVILNSISKAARESDVTMVSVPGL